MTEKASGVPEERPPQGHEIYVGSMEKSADAKFAEIEPWVKEGLIVDWGAGAGPITERLARRFPKSKVLAVDISGDMVKRMRERFKNLDNVEVVDADIANYIPSGKIDTSIHISALHEVYSFNNYDPKVVIQTLRNVYGSLNSEGREIIRDGIQPEPGILYIKPLTEFAEDRFFKFVKGFSAIHKVPYKVGKFDGDNLSWRAQDDVKDLLADGMYIKIFSQDASEMFSKFFYPEINLQAELKEKFGIWTVNEYKKVLSDIGFNVVHAESFLLDYLLQTHYTKNFEVYCEQNGVLSHAPYPPSTILLVGEK